MVKRSLSALAGSGIALGTCSKGSSSTGLSTCFFTSLPPRPSFLWTPAPATAFVSFFLLLCSVCLIPFLVATLSLAALAFIFVGVGVGINVGISIGIGTSVLAGAAVGAVAAVAVLALAFAVLTAAVAVASAITLFFAVKPADAGAAVPYVSILSIPATTPVPPSPPPTPPPCVGITLNRTLS